MIIKKNKIKQWEERKEEQAVHESELSAVNEEPPVVSDYSQENIPISHEEQEELPDVTNIEPVLPPEPEIDLFNIENIDFEQRQERRRGTRRRGYRRIDDRNLVSRAEEEAENIKKSAFDEGYRTGLAKAAVDIEEFKGQLKEFMGAPKEVFEYVAPDILEISVDIAKKIIKKELASDPQVLLDIILDVLKNVSKNESKVNIRVNPQAVAFLKDSLPTVTYEYGIESKINIIADPSIEYGGCVFQTNNGIVDASIDTQLEIIKKALEGI